MPQVAKDSKVTDTLYSRLGGYDAIVAVADNLLPRLAGDDQLRRFWDHRVLAHSGQKATYSPGA